MTNPMQGLSDYLRAQANDLESFDTSIADASLDRATLRHWAAEVDAARALAAPAPTQQPRFFMDHGVWHDRETGKHLFYEGEGPEAETLSDAWAALVAVGYERDGVTKE